MAKVCLCIKLLLVVSFLAAMAYSKPASSVADKRLSALYRKFYAQMMSTCLNGMFSCGNGQCVAGTRRCDGHPDCSNGADEAGCTCSSSQFQCLNNECVDKTRKCDDTFDCSNHEDEQFCGCPSGYTVCSQVGNCVSNSYVCDGYPDCASGSDEEGCEGRVENRSKVQGNNKDILHFLLELAGQLDQENNRRNFWS